WTLRAALQRIAKAGNGVVVILHEEHSLRDLTDAVQALAAAPSEPTSAQPPKERGGEETGPHEERSVLRTYGIGAQILKDLAVKRMRVLSAPKQMHGISAFDLEIEGYVSEES